MFKLVKAFVVTCSMTAASLPAHGQTKAFMFEFGFLFSVTAASRAYMECPGFALDPLEIAVKAKQLGFTLDEHKWLMQVFTPIHSGMIAESGLDRWCATQWAQIGPNGSLLKGFLVSPGR